MSGFTWGAGGLSIIITAKIAETIGIGNMLEGLIVFPFANLVFAYLADSSHWFKGFH
jgi:hypothetical protein